MPFYKTQLELEHMLLFHTDFILSNPHIIEFIYGNALYYSNIRIISRINLFVREYNIKISRCAILQNMYQTRLAHIKKNNYFWRITELCHQKLEDNKKKELEYIHMYWKSFEVK